MPTWLHMHPDTVWQHRWQWPTAVWVHSGRKFDAIKLTVSAAKLARPLGDTLSAQHRSADTPCIQRQAWTHAALTTHTAFTAHAAMRCSWCISREALANCAKCSGFFPKEAVQFQRKVLATSGLGNTTHIPDCECT